jgi:hypothetical protein
MQAILRIIFTKSTNPRNLGAAMEKADVAALKR